MTREEFLNRLQAESIPADSCCFDELLGRDCVFWVREAHGIWELSFLERGKEYDYHRFSSEPEALEFLYEKHLRRKPPRSSKPKPEEPELPPVIYL